MKPKRILSIALMGVVGANIAFFFFSQWFHLHRNTPPRQAIPYREFVDAMPESTQLALLSSNDATFLQVTGPLTWGLAVPSGPPVYIFDHTGVLVAWTYDSGDDPEFSSDWLNVDTRRAISTAEAAELFGS